MRFLGSDFANRSTGKGPQDLLFLGGDRFLPPPFFFLLSSLSLFNLNFPSTSRFLSSTVLLPYHQRINLYPPPSGGHYAMHTIPTTSMSTKLGGPAIVCAYYYEKKKNPPPFQTRDATFQSFSRTPTRRPLSPGHHKEKKKSPRQKKN